MMHNESDSGAKNLRVAVVGNSGSGKSFLAGWIARSARIPVLDLDSIAWEPDPPVRLRPGALACADVGRFCETRPAWVVEGCYADLIAVALRHDPLLVFLNPGVETCIAHCRSRAWEPHKYASAQEQDAQLEALVAWVADYERRDGPLSLGAHRALFEAFTGKKIELRRAPRLDPPEDPLLEGILGSATLR
jgi:adenylate kinase family enzyme